MTDHIIALRPADDYYRTEYGILFESATAHTIKGRDKYRLKVWDNTFRPNTDPNEPGAFNVGNVGPGKYIDPHRKGTDIELSYLLTTEATVIQSRAYGDLGKENSAYGDNLTVGDTVTLISAGGVVWPHTFTVTGDSYHGYHLI